MYILNTFFSSPYYARFLTATLLRTTDILLYFVNNEEKEVAIRCANTELRMVRDLVRELQRILYETNSYEYPLF